MGVVSWYRHLIAITTKNPSRYARAHIDVIMVFASAALISLYMFFNRLVGIDPFSSEYLNISIAVYLASASMSIPFISSVSRVMEMRTRSNEELYLALIAAAGAAKTGLELLDFMRYLGSKGSSVLRETQKIGSWLSELSDLLGYLQAMHMLSKHLYGDFKRMLIEYASAISLGTAVEYMLTTSRIMIAEASQRINRLIYSRTQIMIYSVSFATLIIVILAGLSVFTGSEMLFAVFPLIIILSIIAIAAMPKYPLPLRIIISRRKSATLNAIFAASILASIAIFSISWFSTKQNLIYTAKVVGAMLLVSGLYGLHTFAGFIADMNRVAEIISKAREHVRIYRSLLLFQSSELERIMSKSSRPALVDYLADVLEFFKSKGDMEPTVFEEFSEYVMMLRNGIRSYIPSIVISIVAILILPYLLTSISTLGGLASINVDVYTVVASMSVSAIATKAAFGWLMTTSLMGLSLLMLR